MNNRWLFLPALICSAFAVRTLFMIDTTSLWSDELYSVGKSFQTSFSRLMAMLREDPIPPLTAVCFGFGDIWSARAR